MRERWNQLTGKLGENDWLLLIWGAIITLSVIGAVVSDFYLLMGLPLFFLLIFLTVVDFKKIYFLLLFCIPLSTEFYLPNGLGTDLPTEPLMIGLTLVYLLYFLSKKNKAAGQSILFHPLSLLLLLHISWIYFTTFTSSLLWVSVKFSLAKTWYLIVFFFLSALLLKKERDYKSFFWIIFLPLLITVIITIIRHAAIGFSFELVHTVFHPFHRNHVSYAALLALFLPFIWFARKWYKPNSLSYALIIFAIPIFLVGIYYSFTRAAYVAVILIIGAYFVFHLRLIKYAILGATVVLILGLAYLVNDNKYLELAPEYNKTISHTEFDNLLEATYKGEDISTMERLFRWVAGFNMVGDQPLVGFGPGNFTNFYQQYTVKSFKTYVSRNEDRSGIHSYYLMTAVEQGIPGAIFYLILCFATLIIGERIYHQTKNPIRKPFVMAALLCLVVIHAFQIINDMLETDKMGPFFFICIAILVNADLKNQAEQSNLLDNSDA